MSERQTKSWGEAFSTRWAKKQPTDPIGLAYYSFPCLGCGALASNWCNSLTLPDHKAAETPVCELRVKIWERMGSSWEIVVDAPDLLLLKMMEATLDD